MADGKIIINTKMDNSDVDKGIKDLQKSIKDVGSSVKDVGENMTKYVTTPITLVGGAALKVATDFDTMKTKMTNALGLTAQEADKLAESAKGIWSDGFGESLEDVSTAMMQVKQNMKGLNEGEIEEVTKNAMTLASTFDSEVNEVTRAGNNIMENFGITSQEAFDLMAAGAQNGLNFSNEMFDNLAEYAPLFADAGYSAEEMFTLLEKGAEKGIYNLDYLNDVVKEFGIKVMDGSEATTDAMAMLFAPEDIDVFTSSLQKSGKKTEEYGELVKKVGKDTANQLVENLQKGGKKAEDATMAIMTIMGDYNEVMGGLSDGSLDVSTAMDMVIGKLNEIEDPIERNMLGVQLFGTKWEDLGADVVLSLGGVKGALMDVDGTMGTMTENQEKSFGQQFQATLRQVTEMLLPLGQRLLELAQTALPYVQQGIETVVNVMEKMSPTAQIIMIAIAGVAAAIGPLLVVLGSVVGAVGNLIPIFTKAGTVLNVLKTVFMALSGPVGIFIGLITAAIAIGVALYKNWDEVVVFLKKAWTSIVNACKETVDFLKSAFSESYNEIKTNTINQWNAIVSAFTGFFNTILNAMRNFGNGIKTAFSTAMTAIANAVKTGATAVITAFKWLFDTAKQNAMNMVGEWKNIGTWIVEGLAGGIKNAFGKVKEAVSGVVSGAVGIAKNLLGIHSPSRVFKEIGLWTGEGLVIGIEESEGSVKAATEDMVGGIIDVNKEYQKEYTQLIDDFNQKMEDKNDATLNKIYSIQNNAAKKKRKMTQEEIKKVSILEAQYRDDKIKAEQEFDKKYLALVQKSEKAYLEVMTSSLEARKAEYGMSNYEEARYWENLIDMFQEGSSERLKVIQNYNKAVDATNAEFEAMEQEHVDQIKEIDSELIKNIEEIEKKYNDAVDSRAAKLDGFANQFDAFSYEITQSGQDLMNNLQSQIDGFRLWEETIDSLVNRSGVSEALAAELSGMGVEALPQLLALNQLTDEQLTKYSEMFDERSTMARERAIEELSGLREESDEQITLLNEEASKKLDVVIKSFDEAMKAVTKNTSNELGKLKQIGVNAGQGLLNGLSSMEGPIIEKANSIASAVAAAMSAALDIHSPSRVTKEIGMWAGKGLELGIEGSIDGVIKASTALANATVAPIDNASTVSTNNIDNSRTNNTPITVYGGDGDVAKKIAREQRRQLFGFNA